MTPGQQAQERELSALRRARKDMDATLGWTPTGGLMDKRFVYVPAASTNVAETFKRVRAEQANGRPL